jgi:signal transduction histidine kinase
MIGLYVYAASGTVGPAIARQNVASLNADMSDNFTLMSEAVENEQADSFVYQSSRHRAFPDSKLTADYSRTDATVAAFEAGLNRAKADGDISASGSQALPGLSSSLAQRAGVRATVQAGSLDGLATFKEYLSILESFIPFSIATSNPNESVQFYEQSFGLIDAGLATEDMAGAASLLGGIEAGGGYMSPDEYQLFESLYNQQAYLFGVVNAPVYWLISPNPYYTSVGGRPPALQTPEYQAAVALEKTVLTAGSNRQTVRLPITPQQVQRQIGGALAPNGPLLVAENTGFLGITADSDHQGNVIEARLAAVGGAGLLVVILSTLLLLRFSRRITRELTGLRNAAQRLSGERLPSVVRRLRAGDDVDVAAEAPPLTLKTKTREVTDTADAFSVVQHTAIEAAVEQALLRKGVANVFRSLARRNQSLVQRQLRMLDEMERGTQDPDALAQLFRLDHLTTRMRRQAEGLIILSGSAPGRRWRQPVPVVEILRGAISEIEDYLRVDLRTQSPDFLTGAAVADVTHLLAELIENAVVFSPPATRVQVRGGRVGNGYAVEIDDCGLGIPPATRDKLNERLAQPVEFDLADSSQLGLFVVSRLAVRHGIKVSLQDSSFGGITAIVLIPNALVVSEQEAEILAGQGTRAAIAWGGRGDGNSSPQPFGTGSYPGGQSADDGHAYPEAGSPYPADGRPAGDSWLRASASRVREDGQPRAAAARQPPGHFQGASATSTAARAPSPVAVDQSHIDFRQFPVPDLTCLIRVYVYFFGPKNGVSYDYGRLAWCG